MQLNIIIIKAEFELKIAPLNLKIKLILTLRILNIIFFRQSIRFATKYIKKNTQGESFLSFYRIYNFFRRT